MIISPPAARWRLLPRVQAMLLYPVAVGLGVLAGYSLLMNPPLVKLLLLLPALVFAGTISPEKLFVGWLFCAPLVQGASDGTHPAHIVYTVLFLVPPLILGVRLATGAAQLRSLWAIDVLPALYLCWVLVSVHLVASEFTGNSSGLRAVYAAVGIGIFTYYFTAFGTTTDWFHSAVVRALLWSGLLVAALALAEASTGWNLWDTEVGGGAELRRVVSTFTSPGALGAYLGVGIAFAVGVVVWDGPRSLRLPSILLIGLSIPALYFTYTRGPVIAAAVVAAVMALVANRARWPSLLVFATLAVLVFASWGQLSSSAIYKERLGVTSTAETRLMLQDVSLDLFRQRPVFGWGYDTFDQVKLTVPVHDRNLLDTTTSHNTFLTVLDELGVVGLGLLVVPWAVISRRAIAAGRRGLAAPWLVGGCVGAAVVCFIGALTYDSRFFAIITALPWISLGLARNILAKRGASAEAA